MDYPSSLHSQKHENKAESALDTVLANQEKWPRQQKEMQMSGQPYVVDDLRVTTTDS